MTRQISGSTQGLLTLAAVLLSVGLSQAQSNRPATPAPDALVRQVRIALGHGSVDDAKTIVAGPAGAHLAIGTAR